MNPCGHWEIVMGHYRFMNCNKYIILMGDIDNVDAKEDTCKAELGEI